MVMISLWRSGLKGANYTFVDRKVAEFMRASGTAVYVHKYLGPHDQEPPDPGNGNVRTLNERSIQDVLLLENRDRRYSSDVYEMRGVYNVQDLDFDMRQFGLFLSNDTIFIEFHLNEMIELLGRKLMAGDVLELPHLRDDALLDPEAPAINKFYVVEDASRATSGYSMTWFPHIWRVKLSPMTGAQEYADILDKTAKDPYGLNTGFTLGDIMTTIGQDLAINEAVVEQAKASVMKRNFETRQFYVVPGNETTGQNPWVFAGDGVPPNGAVPVGNGTRFPDDPGQGDYYLRTDYQPHALFRWTGARWAMQEIDYRQGDWSMAHRLLESFINNRKDARHDDGTVAPERQNLSKAIRPKADF